MTLPRPFTALLGIVLGSALAVPAAAQDAGTGEGERRLADADIAAAVQREIRHDPATSSDELDITVTDGVVMLDGVAKTLLQRDYAERLAETVRGVRAIVNDIAVEPPADRSDAMIAEDVEDALRADPAADSFEIEVRVEQGAVTLRGTVQSWAERSLASRVARGVRGVIDVRDEIDVELVGERSDRELQAEIEQRLRWDALVEDSGVNVDVDDGHAILTGFVGSAAEKRRARADSWVRGITRVSSDDLEVLERVDDPLQRDTVRGGWEPAAVEDAIRMALVHDPRVVAADVEVRFRHAVATLDGRVDNAAAKRAAERAARQVAGVASVVNDIDVQPVERDPARIRAEVRQAFERDSFLESYEIDVGVSGQDVILTGIVESWFEKLRAADLAATTRGVDRVRNRIEVMSIAPYVYEPFLDDSYPYGSDWYRYQPSMAFEPDFVVENAIEIEIRWSPFVDAEQVEVEVNDGTAHLTGTVDSFAEREAASENAFEGGAVWVVNDLEVDRSGDV